MVSEQGTVSLFRYGDSATESVFYDDLAIHPWPPRSPDLTVCDFFLWGYIKDKVYVPPLPTNLEELKIRIKDAVNAVTPDIISKFDYRIDVCRAAGGGHIEHL